MPTSRNPHNMQARQRSSPLWLRAAQAICTLGLAVVLWRSIDWGQFLAAFVGLRWESVALAALLLLIAHGFNIVRWRGLLPPNIIPPGALVAYYGAGLFASNFLPTGVGGDAVRVGLAGPRVGWAQALLSVALDRGIGLAGLSFFILPGLWLGLPEGILERFALPPSLPSTLWALIGAGAVALVLIGGALVYRRPSLARAIVSRLRQGDDEASAPRRGWRGWAGMVASSYFLSVCAIQSSIAAHWAVLHSLGITVPPGAAVWLLIIGSLALMVPISINGLGVLESVFVIVLAAYGVPAPAALATALLIRALILLYSLLGGLISLGQGWYGGGFKRAPLP